VPSATARVPQRRPPRRRHRLTSPACLSRASAGICADSPQPTRRHRARPTTAQANEATAKAAMTMIVTATTASATTTTMTTMTTTTTIAARPITALLTKRPRPYDVPNVGVNLVSSGAVQRSRSPCDRHRCRRLTSHREPRAAAGQADDAARTRGGSTSSGCRSRRTSTDRTTARLQVQGRVIAIR
jgi:hypothetical protein